MRLRGRIPYVDSNNPDSWGRCDKTGLPVMYSKLRPQMEYRGNVLSWTGLMVNQKELDEPNPQLIPPKLKPDPVPLRNPRYFPLPAQPGIPTNLRKIEPESSTSVTVGWDFVEEAEQYAVYWECLLGKFSTLKPQKGNPILQPTPIITEPFYRITELSPNTRYMVAVASLNNLGYQKGVDGFDLIQSYNISSPSYGPESYLYGGRFVPNPYYILSVTTLP
jgi:hypothetical protein